MARPADIIVVGAGIVGCAIAHELARRGTPVEVVDDRGVGLGATQASAGVLAPFIDAREGHPLLPHAIRSLGLWDEFVSRVTADSGLPVPYVRSGTIDAALDEADLATLRTTASVLGARGVPARLLDASEARAEEPRFGDGVAAALVIDAHGYVAAGELTRALAIAARRLGAHIVEGSRVLRIARAGDDVAVETSRGTLTAGAVVVAPGSWAGDIEIDDIPTRLPVRPIRGQLLSLAWRGAPPLKRVTWSSRCYLVPWNDGTLLVGATVEDAGFDERVTTAGVRDLIDAACDLIPHAWSAGFNGARVGLRPATPDQLPIIGRSRVLPNVMYATGHYRNGVLLAPLTAQIVADALLEDRTDEALEAMGPARFNGL